VNDSGKYRNGPILVEPRTTGRAVWESESMSLRSVIAVVTVAAAAVVMPASGASAAGSCSVVAPTKVVMDAPYEEVVLRLSSNCASAGLNWAAWDIVHPGTGYAGSAFFENDTVDYWDLYDWEGPARYSVRPSGAYDTSYDTLPQNTAYITVKLGSRLTATTTRSSGVLTFSAYARTYSPSLSDWYKRAGAKVSLMYLAPGSSTWTWVKAATTGSTGRVTLSVAPKYGQYRLMIKETDRVWASYSSIVRGK
jgi:hypothetical protein